MAPKRNTVGRIRLSGKTTKAAVEKIKRGPAARSLLTRHARRIARHANATLIQKQKYADYNTGFHEAAGTKDPTATVFTQSNHAKYSNAKRNTLIKVIK
jgi:hypothetical protein